MKKLIKGKKYHDNLDDTNFEVINIDESFVFVKYDELIKGYSLENDGSVIFPLSLFERDYNLGEITDIK